MLRLRCTLDTKKREKRFLRWSFTAVIGNVKMGTVMSEQCVGSILRDHCPLSMRPEREESCR